MDFSKILNWQLLKGSHGFPGPDGGTCINEAAIVAAGFEYRSVSSASDCPPCFSRPIATYAIHLNDAMPDRLRQQLLMPFVARLAGSADTPAIEQQRADLIVVRTCQKILAPLFASLQLKEHAAALAAASNFNEAISAAARAAWAAEAAEAAKARVWPIAVEILDEALRIGRQAEVIDTALIGRRMEQMKHRARHRVPVQA